jgi:hypothetical protein
MDQFSDIEQIKNYDLARPKYTGEIFTEILNNSKNFDSHLDIACGTGQVK